MDFITKIKTQWSELLLGDLTPQSLALGLAIGTFIALLPTFGFGVFMALLLIFIFPHINRPAVLVAFLIWNPLTQIPIYALSFQLGSILFAGVPVVQYDFEMLNQIYSFTRRFLVAHVLITSVITTIIYFGSLSYFYRKKI